MSFDNSEQVFYNLSIINRDVIIYFLFYQVVRDQLIYDTVHISSQVLWLRCSKFVKLVFPYICVLYAWTELHTVILYIVNSVMVWFELFNPCSLISMPHHWWRQQFWHIIFNYFQKRGVFKDLAPMLWYSFGTMAALLQV